MRRLIFILSLMISAGLQAQDLSGTWEGELSAGVYGVPKVYKMKWELIQIEREVYGILYLYPQDTKVGDQPDVVYTWYGKQGKEKNFPFTFIMGRYLDGLGKIQAYQFNVAYSQPDSLEKLSGKWFSQLEPLNTLDKGRGTFTIKKISEKVSDRLWLKRKEKEILQKLEERSQ